MENSREQTLRSFDELYEPLQRYLRCLGASQPEAEDAAQETFLRLHRHLNKNGLPASLCGCVFQVARNYLRDAQRSARRHRTVSPGDKMDRSGSPPAPVRNPEQQALDEERSQRLRIAIESLPAQQRECMLLRSSGLRYREIAEVLGINPSNVGTLVHRAVARLIEELR
jgi:RNA polymerase sigma-70 factor (ECF subfamily)